MVRPRSARGTRVKRDASAGDAAEQQRAWRRRPSSEVPHIRPRLIVAGVQDRKKV
jgi:hypothetical protein